MKQVTFISNYEDRKQRKHIQLKKGYTFNNTPYEYMVERYNKSIQLFRTIKLDNKVHDQIREELHYLIGEKATNYAIYRIFNKEKVMDKDFKDYIQETIYNKVLYWNIYNNNYTRRFLVYIPLEGFTYETSEAIKINKYYHPQVEQFTKALLDTKATIKFQTTNSSMSYSTKSFTGKYWDCKNELWNQILLDLIAIEQNSHSTPTVPQSLAEKYKDLLTKYNNLDQSEIHLLTDYNTSQYHKTESAVREVDILTYQFLKENHLLEEQIDLEDLDHQLQALKCQIADHYDRGNKDYALELFQLYEELDAKRSKEYHLENDLGYNPILG